MKGSVPLPRHQKNIRITRPNPGEVTTLENSGSKILYLFITSPNGRRVNKNNRDERERVKLLDTLWIQWKALDCIFLFFVAHFLTFLF